MSFLDDDMLCKLYAHCSLYEKMRDQMRTAAQKRRGVIQQREMEENRWFLGVQLRHEISLNEAALDFGENPIVVDGKRTTHAERFSRVYHTRFPVMNAYCNQRCTALECRAVASEETYTGCPLSNEEIHQKLRD